MSSSTKQPSPGQTKPSAPERRFDPITGNWVVIAGNRDGRPIDRPTTIERPRLTSCPFCVGRESETTPATAAWPPPASSPHDFPWQVRVVPNLYPAFVPPDEHHVAAASGKQAVVSHGQHEVVIESPLHLTRVEELSPDEAELVFHAYRHRLSDYAQDPAIIYGIAFKNCGTAAGMSREHVHSQLAGLPFVPPVVELELARTADYFLQSGTCLFCEMIDQERQSGERWVMDTPNLVAICPYASRSAYETWILPKTHQSNFETAPDHILSELARLVQNLLKRLDSLLEQPAFNYVLHTSPFDTIWKDHYHWHIEIIPRIARLAGLEWGTGVYVNTVAPERAADRLRNPANG